VSLYQVQKFLFDLNRDRALQERFSSDAIGLLAGYLLTDEERQAIESRDVGLLYVLGANGQLLMHYAALIGMAWPDYIAAMRAGVLVHGPVRAGIYSMTTRMDEKVAGV
jgi:Aromatic-ring-opening dioxygenase LigAB, LigA subunit